MSQHRTAKQVAEPVASTEVEKLTFVLIRGDECHTLELQLSSVPLDPAALPGWFMSRTPTRWVAARIL